MNKIAVDLIVNVTFDSYFDSLIQFVVLDVAIMYCVVSCLYIGRSVHIIDDCEMPAQCAGAWRLANPLWGAC